MCFWNVLGCLRHDMYWCFWIFRENCGEKMEQFLKRCFYHSGQYDSETNFAELDKKLKEHEVMRAWARQCDRMELFSLQMGDKLMILIILDEH